VKYTDDDDAPLFAMCDTILTKFYDGGCVVQEMRDAIDGPERLWDSDSLVAFMEYTTTWALAISNP
jgi:hypothetical protein